MAIEIKSEKLKEIAEYLDMGMLCFYHKTTGKLESYPKDLEFSGLEDEWADVTEKMDANLADYLEIEAMGSSQAFRVMESFIDDIDHGPTHNKFIDAISSKKPFQNFNNLLHYYPYLRQQWFAYKLERYIEYVKEQIDQ
jgi:hypothetical protein